MDDERGGRSRGARGLRDLRRRGPALPRIRDAQTPEGVRFAAADSRQPLRPTGLTSSRQRGRAIPGDRPLEPLAERRPRPEAEELARRARRRAAARLAVRHRRVPDDLALEADDLGDELGESRGSRSRSPVPRLTGLGAVVALGREHAAPRRSPRRTGTRGSASRRPRARPRSGAARASSGSAPGSRASVSRSKLSRGP